MKTSTCGNCGFECPASELNPVKHLEQRLDYPVDHPKVVLPDGECPRCGALSYATGKTRAGAVNSEIAHVMMQDVVGDYDAPGDVPEWQWVEANASYAHCQNGQSGVWEFVLNLGNYFSDVPDQLKPVIDGARESGCAYLIIHQGT